MVPFLPVIALVIGLVFAFSFDTTGPRTHVVDRRTIDRERATTVPDEDVHDSRHDDDVVDAEREPSVAERIRTRDEASEPAGTTRIDRPVDRP